MGFSLRLKMIAASVLILFFVVALFGVLQGRVITGELGEQTELLRTVRIGEARTVSLHTIASLSATSRFAIADNDFSALQDQLGPLLDESRGSDLPLVEALITDPQGRTLAWVGAEGDKPEGLDRKTLGGIKTPAALIQEDDQGAPGSVTASAPIIDRNDTLWGYVRLSYDLAGLRGELERIEQEAGVRRRAVVVQVALVGALAILLGVAVAILQALAITRPIEELSRSASRIAQGEIQTRVQVKAGGEIGQMARNFNHMAERLGELLAETAAKTAMERELQVARVIQETLLPARGQLRHGRLTLAGYLESASMCGGDFWTWAELGQGRTLLCVGDVTGHGVPSAMITAACKSGLDTLRSVTHGRFGVEVLLAELNKTILEAARRKFAMTFFAIIVDQRTGAVELGNAGHNFPVHVSPGGGRSRALVCRGNRLGDDPESRYEVAAAQLQPGDLLCLYTDGLTEYLNPEGEMFGERRLRRLLEKHAAAEPQALIDTILADLHIFAAGAPQEDDVTLVVARFEEVS